MNEKRKVSDIDTSDLDIVEIGVEAGKIHAMYSTSKSLKFMTFDMMYAVNVSVKQLVEATMKENLRKNMYYGWSKEQTDKAKLDIRGRIKSIMCSIVRTGKNPFRAELA